MNQNKRIYIITGSIASGKSTFSNILRKKNFNVIDADKIVHNLYEKNEIKKILVSNFSDNILVNNEIDRKILGNIVFNNKEKKLLLESIIHPVVINSILEEIENSDFDIIFVEIPVYSKVEKYLVDKIKDYKLIYITLDENEQIKRLMKRNKISYDEAKNLIRNNENNFNKKVDYYIENCSTLDILEKNVCKFIKRELLDESN